MAIIDKNVYGRGKLSFSIDKYVYARFTWKHSQVYLCAYAF
ncbi:hypothetical protein ABTJ_p0080 (plasmid) [Acinetobacter baumannii MDR-TJ]|nr:hypothetical protein ABTJ_p0004 [Acinetobacter baumannii MDR-TJ]AFI97458.1 hypothetical protein ABTJ_p0080 [Acinetobacter baumannii MDR-TJ]